MDPENDKTPPEGVDTPPAEAVDVADDPIAAMDKGIAEATAEAQPEPEAETAPEGAQPEGGEPKPEGEQPEGQPAPEAKTDEPKPDDKRPSDEFGELPKDTKAETRERFDKLKSSYDELHKEVEPLRVAMKAAGIENMEQATQAISRVKDADYVLTQVMDSGASAEQYSMSLEYLTLVNKGVAGDMKSLEAAWALIEPEIKVLAAALGKELPGMHDPLEAHADLREAIEAGDMTRKHALEVAQLRGQNTVRQQADARTREQQGAQQKQAQAVTDARAALTALGNELAAADPAGYAAKQPALVAKIREIAAQHPPHEWPQRAAIAYATLQAPAPVQQERPPVGPVPLRPVGGRPNVEPATFDDPMAALDFGVAQASR